MYLIFDYDINVWWKLSILQKEYETNTPVVEINSSLMLFRIDSHTYFSFLYLHQILSICIVLNWCVNSKPFWDQVIYRMKVGINWSDSVCVLNFKVNYIDSSDPPPKLFVWIHFIILYPELRRHILPFSPFHDYLY